jgi:hypothetical protein
MKLDKVMSKINKTTTKLLTNKMVLNVVAILAFLNIIGYLMMGKLNDVAYFIIIAILTRYFSKNMIVVLGVPLVITNLLACKCAVTEGMNNRMDSNQNNENKQKKAAVLKSKQNNNDEENNNERYLDDSTMNNSIAANMNNKMNTQDGFENGRKKHDKYNIDYASTIENAYDDLNNILGSDGIQRLTSDTQKLMNQQMQLAEAMKGMGPMVESLSPMVDQLKGMMGDNGMQNMMDLAKQFTKPKTNNNQQ